MGLRGQDAGPGCQDVGPGGQDVTPVGQDLGLMRLGCGSLRPESGTQEPEFKCRKQGSGFPRPRSWSQWLGSGSQRPNTHRGTLVHPTDILSNWPPMRPLKPEIAISGLRSALSGLKSAFSSLARGV